MSKVLRPSSNCEGFTAEYSRQQVEAFRIAFQDHRNLYTSLGRHVANCMKSWLVRKMDTLDSVVTGLFSSPIPRNSM